jgi:hypothetical protein
MVQCRAKIVDASWKGMWKKLLLRPVPAEMLLAQLQPGNNIHSF